MKYLILIFTLLLSACSSPVSHEEPVEVKIQKSIIVEHLVEWVGYNSYSDVTYVRAGNFDYNGETHIIVYNDAITDVFKITSVEDGNLLYLVGDWRHSIEVDDEYELTNFTW